MAEKVPNPKAQMIRSAPASLSAALAALPSMSLSPLAPFPSNLQITNSKVAATPVSCDLAIGISLELGVWDLELSNF
jgi:hypothetical protein